MNKQDSRAYYKALGAHMALLRKSRGMTQAELARSIGVSQQAIFAYEIGDRRPSVFVLVKTASKFGLTMNEVVGMERPVRKSRSRLSPRAMRHAQRLQVLPKTQQRFVLRILDQLEASNKAS